MRLHDAAFESNWIAVLRQERIKRGLKQSFVAEQLGVNRASLCQWETGVSCPSTFTIWNRWAKFLGFGPIIAEPPQEEWEDE